MDASYPGIFRRSWGVLMMQPSTVTDLNFNAAKCIQEASHFGYTEYTNICNHTSTIVIWGGVDWFAFVALGALALAILTLIIGLGIQMIRY